MANKETPQYYLECLRHDLAKAVGRSINTYTDFNFLYLELKKRLSEAPSVSTLKRLWAYIPDSSSRSRSTLNTLSRFLGFNDWTHYVENLMRQNRVESGFLEVNNIVTSSLSPGDRIELTWNPGRRMSAIYRGANRFVVDRSENAKITEGSEFTALLFTKGMPLSCTDVTVDGVERGVYVAGSESGIISINYTPACALDSK